MAQFTALPLRPRNTLEIIDTSLKVYKQYGFVLLTWSAAVKMGGTLLSLIPVIGTLFAMAGWLLVPLELSANVCCVAGAVRGQEVTLRQSLNFGKARFGTTLMWFVLANILLIAAAIALCIPLIFIIALAAGAAAAATPLAVVGGVTALVLGSIAVPIFYSWSHLVVIVACMEEMREGVNPLQRSWNVMRGQWARVIGMITILGLGALLLFIVFFAAGASIIGLEELRRSFSNGLDSADALKTIALFAIAAAVAQTFFEPAMMLALVLFYLDVRVRQEALDLEWASYESGERNPVAAELSAPTAPAASFSSLSIPAHEEPPAEPQSVEGLPTIAWQNLDLSAPSAQPVAASTLPPSKKSCPNCGVQAVESALFCMACGTVLNSTPSTP